MKSELGYTSSGKSCCVLFNAADIILLSGSVNKMQKISNVCSEYRKEYGINFNALSTAINYYKII